MCICNSTYYCYPPFFNSFCKCYVAFKNLSEKFFFFSFLYNWKLIQWNLQCFSSNKKTKMNGNSTRPIKRLGAISSLFSSPFSLSFSYLYFNILSKRDVSSTKHSVSFFFLAIDHFFPASSFCFMVTPGFISFIKSFKPSYIIQPTHTGSIQFVIWLLVQNGRTLALRSYNSILVALLARKKDTSSCDCINLDDAFFLRYKAFGSRWLEWFSRSSTRGDASRFVAT